MTDMNEKAAVRALAALAQEARIRIYRAVVGIGPDGITPGALASVLGIVPSTVSFHVKELLNAGLVTQERIGRHLIYRPCIDTMNALLGYLTAHCCQAAAFSANEPSAALPRVNGNTGCRSLSGCPDTRF